jgi:hypothetical protein
LLCHAWLRVGACTAEEIALLVANGVLSESLAATLPAGETPSGIGVAIAAAKAKGRELKAFSWGDSDEKAKVTVSGDFFDF